MSHKIQVRSDGQHRFLAGCFCGWQDGGVYREQMAAFSVWRKHYRQTFQDGPGEAGR
jgi:hypothetical protein